MAAIPAILTYISTAICAVGKVMHIGLWIGSTKELYSENERNRREYESQAQALLELLEDNQELFTEQSNHDQDEDTSPLENLRQTFEDGLRICAELDPTQTNSMPEKCWRRFKNIVFATAQTAKLDRLRSKYIQAATLARTELQLIASKMEATRAQDQQMQQARENDMLRRMFNPRRGVFRNPNGDKPLEVYDVVAEPKEGTLLVKWMDRENSNKRVEYYEIMLSRPDNFYLEYEVINWTNNKMIGISDVKVRPWERYTVQVRAVNDAGNGPWSMISPSCVAVMHENPPTKPKVVKDSYNAISNSTMSFQIYRPQLYEWQRIVRCVIEKQVIDDVTSNWDRDSVACTFTDDSNTLTVCMRYLQPSCDYKVQVYFENCHGKSEPSDEFRVPSIASLNPSKPRNVSIISQSLTDTEVWIKWEPPNKHKGVVDHYRVEMRTNCCLSLWRKLPQLNDNFLDQLERRLTPMQNRSFMSRLRRSEDETQGLYCIAANLILRSHDFYVVDGLYPNSKYSFRVVAVKEDGTMQSSEVLEVKTKLSPICTLIRAEICSVIKDSVPPCLRN